ncbi:MAG: efflux RND transporter periplasmic adaptor subunit [Muribaculaceae bacterium]|nr:efflux RND transporter periplasmic adaptor subunit [Muribaculaceae bacterium]
MPKETESSFETMTVKKSDIEIPIKFSATMKGQSDVAISPQVSGQLTQICVSEGQRVSRGQVLFVVDSRNAQHEVESAQANLDATRASSQSSRASIESSQANLASMQANLQSAQANLQSAQAKANSAKLEYDSNKDLFEKKIVSNYTLETAKNNYQQALAAVGQAKAAVEQAKASVSQARANVEQARATSDQSRASVSQAQTAVNRAKVNLGFCTITSPVSGVVGEIKVREGDQVSPMTQLTIVSGNQQMEAEFSINESILEAGVSEGYNMRDKEKSIASLPDVIFVMKNGTEYPHKGRVTSITGMVNATTGTLSCKAVFPNPEGHLYSGIQGTVLLPFSQKDVMVIPQNAVLRLQDKSQVYLVKNDSTATAVTVKTTDTGNGKDVIVTEGLKVGDRIVTVGANNVQEGDRVLFPSKAKKESK